MAADLPKQTADQRLQELNRKLASIEADIRKVAAAIAALQKQAKEDPESAADADYADRLTTEGGRKGILEQSRKELQAEIAALSKK